MIFFRFFMTSKQFGLPKIDSKMHCFFDRFFHLLFFDFRSFFSKNQPKSFQKSIPRCITFSIIFSIDFSTTLIPFWTPSWAILGRLGGVLGHLGPSWRPLGGLLGRLGGLLGPLGGQDPPEARGSCFLEASWGRLGLIFGRFLDHVF